MASVKANPKMAAEKSSCLKKGFLDIPKTTEPQINPAPTPGPVKAIVAKPAPINLLDNTDIFLSIIFFLTYKILIIPTYS